MEKKLGKRTKKKYHQSSRSKTLVRQADGELKNGDTKSTKLNCLANLQKQLIALLGIHVKQISIGLQYSSASNSLPPVSDVEELLIFRATPFFNVLSLCFRFKRIFRLILFIFDEVVFLQFFGTSSFKSSTTCFLLF